MEYFGTGGGGGYAEVTIPETPCAQLTIIVGDRATLENVSSPAPLLSEEEEAWGGNPWKWRGLSGVFDLWSFSQPNALVIAGGGGGGGDGVNGGAGGGFNGQNSSALDKAARQVRSSQGATLVKFMVGVHSREEAPTSRAEVEVVEATSEETGGTGTGPRGEGGGGSGFIGNATGILLTGDWFIPGNATNLSLGPRKEMGLAKGQPKHKSLEQMDGSLSNISGVPVSHVRNVRLWARPG